MHFNTYLSGVTCCDSLALTYNLGIFQELHPFYDDNSVLLVQFFGLKVVYTPKSDHSEAGQVQSLTGGELSLSDDDILGWTAVPMFSRSVDKICQ